MMYFLVERCTVVVKPIFDILQGEGVIGFVFAKSKVAAAKKVGLVKWNPRQYRKYGVYYYFFNKEELMQYKKGKRERLCGYTIDEIKRITEPLKPNPV